MSTNPFKAFIPYLVDAPNWDSVSSDHLVTDPSAGDWRRVGLAPPLKGDHNLAVDMQGSAYLMAVQFNERILPGKVRDEELTKRVNKLQAQEGRKISKKEYAELREQTEFDLLPRAFIRRTVVYVFFYTQDSHWRMLVCTSSQKKADDCVAIMRGVFGEGLRPWQITLKGDPSAAFRTLATDPESLSPDTFTADKFIALKGKDKTVVRFKDKPIEDEDCMQCILMPEYSITEIGVEWDESADKDNPPLSFVVTHNLTFKSVVNTNIKPSMSKDDAYGFAVLCIQNYKAMLRQFFCAFGPMVERPAPTSTVNVDDL
jgi:DNA recombination-dependent growth factor C